MTSKERHTIAIIDDHPLFRRGVRELLDLEQGLDVVGEAGTREEAIKLVRRTELDLTILDLNMKGCSGVEILSTLKDEDPSRRIVVLTVSDSGKDLTACIQAGSGGCASAFQECRVRRGRRTCRCCAGRSRCR